MTDMPSRNDEAIYAGRNPSEHIDRIMATTKMPEMGSAGYIWYVTHDDDGVHYHPVPPKAMYKQAPFWQRAKWIVRDDIVAAREFIADVLWNLAEWIRP